MIPGHKIPNPRLSCLQGGLLVLLVASLLPSPRLLAEDETAPPLIAATDEAALKAAKGRTVVVRGKVTRTTKAKATGVNFLNFAAGDFTVVTFGKSLRAFTDGEPADAYKDKHIEVRGEVTLYKDKPQIELRSPDQIRIVDEKEVAEATRGGKKLETGAPAKDANPEEAAKPKSVDPRKYFTD